MKAKAILDAPSWEHKAEVVQLLRDSHGQTVAELMWPDGSCSKHPKSVVFAKMPQTMLAFYDNNLVFEDELTSLKAEAPSSYTTKQAPVKRAPVESSKPSEHVKSTGAKAESAISSTFTNATSATKKTARSKTEPEKKRRESGRRRSASLEPTPAKKKAKFSKEEFFELDKIVDERMRYGKLEYRLRWVGFGPSDDTWSPAEHTMEDAPEAVQDYLDEKAEKADEEDAAAAAMLGARNV